MSKSFLTSEAKKDIREMLEIDGSSSISEDTMKVSIYDTQGRNQDIFEYTNQMVSEDASSGKAAYNLAMLDSDGYDYYNPSETYALGEICRYVDPVSGDEHLYRCTTAINSPEAWNEEHWEKISLTTLVKETMVKVENGGVEVNISGTDVVINAEENHRYICGELYSLSINPPNTGIIDVVFRSGSTPTVVTLPSTVLMPSSYQILANKVYEINIMDGIYGAVVKWDM